MSNPPSETTAPVKNARESKIVVIPDSFYGVALKMQPPFPTDDDPVLAKPVPPPPSDVPPSIPPVAGASPMGWHMPLLIALLLLAIGGGWVYWNRATLFSAPVVNTPPVVVQALPNAPSGLAGTSPVPGTVRLTWEDHSEGEAGYRVERKTNFDAAFIPVQTLPANSLTFLDPTAPPDANVSYRVVAFNTSGETPGTAVDVRVMAPAPAPPAAPTLPPDGLDQDSDGLTDTEELVYGTDARLPDSDNDGYLDGNEVFNLYSPSAAAPINLLTSPLMRVATSTIGWQMLMPAAWNLTYSSSSEATIRAGSGEIFVVKLETRPGTGNPRSWLLAERAWAPEQILELQSNKYKVPFFLGPDRLTAYIFWEGRVLSVAYQLGTQTFVNYRMTFGLMLNSLRLTGSPVSPDLSPPLTIPEAFQRP